MFSPFFFLSICNSLRMLTAFPFFRNFSILKRFVYLVSLWSVILRLVAEKMFQKKRDQSPAILVLDRLKSNPSTQLSLTQLNDSVQSKFPFFFSQFGNSFRMLISFQNSFSFDNSILVPPTQVFLQPNGYVISTL